eukprot:353082-Chlamydomonas_euryale.AAC.13
MVQLDCSCSILRGQRALLLQVAVIGRVWGTDCARGRCEQPRGALPRGRVGERACTCMMAMT